MYSAELLWEKTIAAFETGEYREYRIPGIAVTERGTVLLCCEGRMDTQSDWGQIDIVLWRSCDGGETWEQQVIRLPGAEMMNNPVPVPDGDRVLMVLHTNYARAWCMESTDEGRTWSEPWEITSAYREFSFAWNVCASGPGHGIRTRGGRLIVPVWLANGKQTGPGEFAHQPSGAGAVYSDDHGRTWHAGAWTADMSDANETSLVQLADGRILFNFRNRETDFCRRLGIADEYGGALQHIWKCGDLPDPWCFGGMAALADGTAVFVNCATGAADPQAPRARAHVTVRTSDDCGATWQKMVYVAKDGGYADIAVRGDVMYVLYEEGDTVRDCIARLVLKKYRIAAGACRGGEIAHA